MDVNEKACDTGEESSSELHLPPECWGARHSLSLMGFLALGVVYSLRINLAIAIVSMTRIQPQEFLRFESNVCPFPEDYNSSRIVERYLKAKEFDWDEGTQGLILGSIYYGGLYSTFLGGRLAEHVGGKLVAALGVFVASLFSIISPFCVRVSTTLFVIVRFLQGAALGVVIPSLSLFLASWIPSGEKAKFSTVVYTGIDLGIILTLVMGGWLCDSGVLGGWPLVFYVFGGLGVLWTIAWCLVVWDHPGVHPRISQEEKNYIMSQHGVRKGKVTAIPWRAMLTSLPLWSAFLVHVGCNWGSITLLDELPSYLDHIHHFDMRSNGLLSALPYLWMLVFCSAYCLLVSTLLSHGKLSNLNARRISTAIGCYGRVVGLIALCFVNCNKIMALVVICTTVSVGGTMYSGFMCSLQDLAPNLAGTLMGISTTIAAFPNFVAPTVIGFILRDNQTIEAWRMVFIISASVYLVTGFLYTLVITDKEQPWNDVKTKENKKEYK